MQDETPFPAEAAGFRARLLNFTDLPAVQVLMEQCADYIEMASGSPPSSNEAEMLIAELPPGKTLDDKFLVGFFDPLGELAGLIEAVRDYPGERDWWLGLLLLRPEERSRGAGSQFYRAFEIWVMDQGAAQVQLGVLEANPRAYFFWERLGFEVVESRPSREVGAHQVLVMRRVLASS